LKKEGTVIKQETTTRKGCPGAPLLLGR